MTNARLCDAQEKAVLPLLPAENKKKKNEEKGDNKNAREKKEEHAGDGDQKIMQSGTSCGLGHRAVCPDSAGLATTTPGSSDRSSSHAW